MLANPSAVLSAIVSCLTLGAFASTIPGEDRVALQRRSWLGGIDVDFACKVQNGDNWHAKAVGSKCNGWVCEDYTGKSTSVNMNVACVSQHGLNQAYAKCSPDRVWNWSCHY